MDGLSGNGDGASKGEKGLEVMRVGLDRFGRGLRDAGKLDKSWSLVWG